MAELSKGTVKWSGERKIYLARRGEYIEAEMRFFSDSCFCPLFLRPYKRNLGPVGWNTVPATPIAS